MTWPTARRRAARLLPSYPVRVDAFIIGATKSGTSALFTYLGLHPACVPSTLKEVSFFNNPERYARGTAWYHAQFPRRVYRPWRDYRFLDASPNYLDDEATAQRLRAYNPDARLMVLMRDPVRKSFSLWNHWSQQAQRPDAEKRESFELYVQGFPHADRWWTVMHARPFPSFGEMVEKSIAAVEAGDLDHWPNVVSGAIYVDQIVPYLRHFPREALCTIQSERFQRDRVGVLEAVTRFLRLRPLAWGAQPLPGVHERGYAQGLSGDVEARLRAFYRPHNERLWEVLGERYDWPAA